ncbi:cytochrome b2, mitochondrial [Colletotrichum spaethianum]|uniref:Cytochrome b2, mitochondrial n=1 Tax=Colletotrichum spaethianum TaxID=700344 RepID=A0AA37L7Y5_9PEZI|nr:cytochrome b2, mitochondrial [Colletotrichum spaethianum]GKT41328.1 cytochrome b2, mitochondrial [Colletotrichum spaethianum]
MFTRNTWADLDTFRGMTELPLILKGIQTAADAKAAIQHQVLAIILSNHGGRNLDGSPSALEVAIELYNEDPKLFQQIEVYADGGVRYGSDAVRLLVLGVWAVGLERPFMYANAFGQEGVEKVISIMNTEIAGDAVDLGVAALKNISADLVDWEPNHWFP